MQDLCSSKSKNTALNSKGEEEEEKVKNAKQQAKNPNNTGGRCSIFLFFSDSFLSSASLFAAPLFLKDRLQFQVLLQQLLLTAWNYSIQLFALHSVQKLEKQEARSRNHNKIIYQHIVPGIKFWKM